VDFGEKVGSYIGIRLTHARAKPLQGDKAAGWAHTRLIVAQGLVESLQSKLGVESFEVRRAFAL